MNNHVTDGFLKAAGLGSLVSGAVSKVKSFFGGGASGPITMKLKPKSGVPGARTPAQTPPKMQMLSGNASIQTPMKPATPQQRMNTRIRSEMKRGL